MEKTLSSNDRVRRAEEIYARRQNIRERTKRATVNVSKPKNFKLLKRIVLQIIICILIYFIFYLINTTNYSFSKSTLEKTENLLSFDTDFLEIYNSAYEKIKGYFESLIPEEQTQEENNVEDNYENQIEDANQEEETNGEEGIQEENEIGIAPNPFILPITRKNYIRIWRKRKYFRNNVYIS